MSVVLPDRGVATAARTFVAGVLLTFAPVAGAAGGRALPLDPGVRDPVFAALIAYVRADSHGVVTGEDIALSVAASGRKTRLPFRRIESIARGPGPRPRTEEIRCAFTATLKERIPYSILGYHPGSLRATRLSRWREWELGAVTVTHVSGGRLEPVRLEDVHLWGIVEGEFWMDVDAFVDHILGDRIDDMRLTGLMLFREKGRLVGLALGYNRKNEGYSGVLTFDDDKVAFPSPDRMKTVARTMRAQMEAMLEAETGERRRAGE